MQRIVILMEMEQVSQLLKQELTIMLIVIFHGDILIQSVTLDTLGLMLEIKVAE